jgi:TPR repeat protein
MKQAKDMSNSELKVAAQNGNDEAQYILGYSYIVGDCITVDTQKGLEYFSDAASQGHAKALTELGCFLINGFTGMDGYSIPKDINQAYAHLSKAAETGHAYAAKRLQEIKEKHPDLSSAA